MKENYNSLIEKAKCIEQELCNITEQLNNFFKREADFYSLELNLKADSSILNHKWECGLYYVEIKIPKQILDNKGETEMIDFLYDNWNGDDRKYIPKISKKRVEKYKCYEDKWIPFYLGKSGKINKRMEEHFSKEATCSTYGLKLNKITNDVFKECQYRIKFKKLEELKGQDVYWIMGLIESHLREKINPICGK